MRGTDRLVDRRPLKEELKINLELKRLSVHAQARSYRNQTELEEPNQDNFLIDESLPASYRDVNDMYSKEFTGNETP